jgi:uncharacterized protein involved in exopolysaccharide biosynthesis
VYGDKIMTGKNNSDKIHEDNINNLQSNDILVEEEADPFYMLSLLFKYRYFIVIFSSIFAVFSIIYVLVVTPLYLAEVTMYPVQKYQSNPLRDLATGLGMPNKIEGFHIPEVIKSKVIWKKIILRKYKTDQYKDSVNLIQYWQLEGMYSNPEFVMEKALQAFEGILSVKDDKETFLITISIYMPERQLAVDVANYIGDAVTDYLQKEQRKTTIESKLYIEDRLNYATNKLAEAESDLIKFKNENTITVSPSLRTELIGLERKLKLAQDFATMLEKQRELILIEEVREKPIVNILDTAQITFKPFKPKRRQVVMTNTFFAFVLSIIGVFLKEKYYTKDNMLKLKNILKGKKD